MARAPDASARRRSTGHIERLAAPLMVKAMLLLLMLQEMLLLLRRRRRLLRVAAAPSEP